jgi:hypothetical protein
MIVKMARVNRKTALILLLSAMLVAANHRVAPYVPKSRIGYVVQRNNLWIFFGLADHLVPFVELALLDRNGFTRHTVFVKILPRIKFEWDQM